LGILTIPVGYTIVYTGRWRKAPNPPLEVSNSGQTGSKSVQTRSKTGLPILPKLEKTALALAPRGFWVSGGYQKWGISPNRIYYSERGTDRYLKLKAGFGSRDSGTKSVTAQSHLAGEFTRRVLVLERLAAQAPRLLPWPNRGQRLRYRRMGGNARHLGRDTALGRSDTGTG
jgi:hypothetical protein